MLEIGKMYRVKINTVLWKKSNRFSMPIDTIKKNDHVMFLEYKIGNHKRCKVLFENKVGWIILVKNAKISNLTDLLVA